MVLVGVRYDDLVDGLSIQQGLSDIQEISMIRGLSAILRRVVFWPSVDEDELSGHRVHSTRVIALQYHAIAAAGVDDMQEGRSGHDCLGGKDLDGEGEAVLSKPLTLGVWRGLVLTERTKVKF